MIEVRYDRGTYLPACDLWLDPLGTRPFAFVSHAHHENTGHHQRTILTEVTARLLRARLGFGGKVQHVLRFGESRDFGAFRATLIPAGHVLGAAQILIEQSGESLLYTGGFSLSQGRTKSPVETVHAETLIMETTYGHPSLKFPPMEKTLKRIVAFCQQALAAGEVPVLLGYTLGKAQELLSALAVAGLPVMLHGSIWQMTRRYEELGVSFSPYASFEPSLVTGHVLLLPLATACIPVLGQLAARRTALITGRRLDRDTRERYQCSEVFSLSDHADYEELISLVGRVNPSRVLTMYGFASEFAEDLRRQGIESWALTGGNQMEFSLPLDE